MAVAGEYKRWLSLIIRNHVLSRGDAAVDAVAAAAAANLHRSISILSSLSSVGFLFISVSDERFRDDFFVAVVAQDSRPAVFLSEKLLRASLRLFLPWQLTIGAPEPRVMTDRSVRSSAARTPCLRIGLSI